MVLGEEDKGDMEEVPKTPSDSDIVMEQGGGDNVPHRERIVARIRRVERLVPQFLASILLVVPAQCGKPTSLGTPFFILLVVYQLIVISVRVNSQT